MTVTEPYIVRESNFREKAKVSLTAKEAEWQFISFSVTRLERGEHVHGGAPEQETGIIVLSGSVSISSPGIHWTNVGDRSSVFDGKPYVAYFPPSRQFTIRAETDAEIALARSAASSGPEPYLIKPGDIQEEIRGKGNAQRTIRHLLEADRPAQHLFLVECITPSGNWSSYPPHKHDTDAFPDETYLEETYYHRLNPPQGFAIQRVYTDPEASDAIVVRDGTLVAVRAGYHPVVTAPGYDLYYLNVMAGPIREWRFREDPAHAWLSRQWGEDT